MRNRPTEKRNLQDIGAQVLVTDGAILEATAVARPSRRREGDIFAGMRNALFFSIIIWAGLIIVGVLIFG